MQNKYDIGSKAHKIPNDFIKRRIHSFAGFFFLLFVCEHLFTNSQATYFIGDDGKGFINTVNFIHSLPFLPVLEIVFIFLPLLVHTWFGIDRIRMAKYSAKKTDGKDVSLPDFSRNRAFSWQRITSVLLIFAIALHIYYMRFEKAPDEVKAGYVVSLTKDSGLESVAKRLDVKLSSDGKAYSEDVGTGFLLVLRDTFKSVTLCILYSFFVVIAAFHGTNGLWTFCITWGITLSEHARCKVRYFCNFLMALLCFLGLSAIWGVYWINLRM